MEVVDVALVQSVSGSIYMLTVTTVAIRLLVLARRNRGLPELLLGLCLLVGGTFGASLEAGGMIVKSSQGEPAVAGMMLLMGKLCGVVALTCQGLFIWKLFRPDSRWAPVIVGTCLVMAVAAIAGFWSSGTFSTGSSHMGWFWIELLARGTGSVWLTLEASRYYRMMRKRMEIGLADPVVCNRFLCWAVGGGCGVALLLSAVPPTLYPHSTNPLLAWDILFFSVVGIGFCIAYSLVFFPPARYQHWVTTRAQARAH